MFIKLEQIKELRNLTGAGISAVKEALEASKGNKEEAIKYLREKGIAKAEKRSAKKALNGVLGTYVHGNDRLVVVVEVVCETDFASKSSDMKKFAKDLALHIAAMNPKYIDVNSVDPKELEQEKKSYEKDLINKPKEVKDKIVQGKLEKYYQETVLLKQEFFGDNSKTVEDYLNEMHGKIGEKIEITRFTIIKASESPYTCSLE